MSLRKTSLLGMSHGKAANMLRRNMMFSLVRRLDENFCFRCGAMIDDAGDMSIEHKDSWERAEEPLAAFLDLENVAFSHRSCNYAAAHRPTKKYENAIIREREAAKRHRLTDGWKQTVARRREKRRLARVAQDAGVVQW